MGLSKPIFLLALILSGLALERAHGWSHSSPTATGDCANLDSTGSADDFSFTSIVNKSLFANPGVSDVLKMAFVMPSDTSTHADIIFIERFGAVKYYNALTKTLTLIGTVPGVSTASEDGLLGVAVERPFKNRIYLVYARGEDPNTSASNVINGSFRLSRFSMDVDSHMLDMNSEKVILDVPSARNRWQTSGALEADLDGNLYWAVGDNGTLFTGPGNTHDLRGSIVRIHPNDDGNGYTIPPGNFAEYWANTFSGQGRTALAAQYRDTSLVRPEIFIKGIRDTYAISVEPLSKQVAYSQCGPDYGGSSEVQSNTLIPTFAGWPFWSGTTTVPSGQLTYYRWGGSNEPTAEVWDATRPTSRQYPVNTWTGTMPGTPGPGVDSLPPFEAPKHSYPHSCAMGSVILHYDGRIKNPGQLPPQMDNVWLMGDYDSGKLAGAKVDATGTPVGGVNRFPGIFTAGHGTGDGINSLVDLQQGPDGALYVANLNCNGGVNSGSSKYSDACTGILRIEYKGSCADTALYPRNPVTGIGKSERIDQGKVDWVWVGPQMFSVLAEGPHSIRIWDMQGREATSMRGDGRKEYPIPEALAHNELYILEVRTKRGMNFRNFFRP
ncbi:MAG: PQQ-dependent sugar dehydrogenase [Fibrobacteria bacterium]